MNFQEFKAFRDQVTEEKSLLRLDCMNPFKAMSFLKVDVANQVDCSSEDTLDLWAETMSAHKHRNRAIATGGVRESLKGLFNIFSSNGKEVWLPEDTYPFYWDTAHNVGLKPQSFPTLPTPDLSVLDKADKDSVAVITNPLSPLGRTLNKDEVTQICEWLEVSKDRQIILDTVYSYTRDFDAATQKIFETGQCYIAHSLSKAWLERGVFGVLLPPKKEFEACQRILKTPSKDACTSAFSALKEQNDLADTQQHAFSQEWNRLKPLIQNLAPDFQVPKTGYFSSVSINYKDALEEHGALVIPASVFGARNNTSSIVSCLYNAKPS